MELVDCELIECLPSRNMLCFSKYDEIDYSICNDSLKQKLIYIQNDLKFPETKYEIRANEYNWSIRIWNDKEFAEYNLLLEDKTCIFIEINNIIIKNQKYKCIKNIEYSPLSFRQPDDSIRNHIINIIEHDFIINKYNKYYLLGGEATLIGRLIPNRCGCGCGCGCGYNIIFYTDYKSIYDDLIYNYNMDSNMDSNIIISLVNYKTCENIVFYNDVDCVRACVLEKNNNIIIANTGLQGLGNCLSNFLNTSRIYKIIVISCNPKSWLKDFNILKKNYKIIKTINIKTNYTISLYFLHIIDSQIL
jgi:hypothetical protein